MKALFIGGIKDGETIEVSPDERYLDFPHLDAPSIWQAGKFEAPTKEAIKFDRYERQYLHSREIEYPVFVCGDPSQIIKMLLQGYRKPKEKEVE